MLLNEKFRIKSRAYILSSAFYKLFLEVGAQFSGRLIEVLIRPTISILPSLVSQNVLRNGTLFFEFTSCCWLNENASWSYFAFLSRYLLPLKTKGISFTVCRRNAGLDFL